MLARSSDVFGFTLTADQADENEEFLPDNSELIAARDDLARSFPESSALEAVQIVLRGDVLTPGGAADSFAATQAAASDGGLASYIVAGRPPTSTQRSSTQKRAQHLPHSNALSLAMPQVIRSAVLA